MSRNRIIPFNHPSWDYSLWESIKSQREKMQQEEMDKLPSPTYQDGELIYHYGEGFKPINSNDFFKYSSLCYNTVWSIGCPFKCTYCGNSKFIDNDDAYRKLRHSSPNIIIEEIKRAVSKHPYI